MTARCEWIAPGAERCNHDAVKTVMWSEDPEDPVTDPVLGGPAVNKLDVCLSHAADAVSLPGAAIFELIPEDV